MAGQLLLASSAAFAVAAGWSAWTLLSLSSRCAASDPALSPLELERRQKLREANGTFARFEPLVDELASWNQRIFDERQLGQLEHALALVGSSSPWHPQEYVACKQLEGVLAGGVVAGISLLRISVVPAVVVGAVIAFVYVYTSLQGVHATAAGRAGAIKRRLPFAVDLMALMLEAGAGFQEALRTVARESGDHPLGQELRTVVRHCELGRPRSQALDVFQRRIGDEDVTDLVSAINKGEELGTPLSAVMRTQADQMLLKRSQWGEKAAAEAHVRMTFPSMVVMLASMLLILAPFVLPSVLRMF